MHWEDEAMVESAAESAWDEHNAIDENSAWERVRSEAASLNAEMDAAISGHILPASMH